MAVILRGERWWWLVLSVSNNITVAMWSREPTAKARMPLWTGPARMVMLETAAPRGDIKAKMPRQTQVIFFPAPEIFNNNTNASAAGIWCRIMP